MVINGVTIIIKYENPMHAVWLYEPNLIDKMLV
jgi:hypothetical protein